MNTRICIIGAGPAGLTAAICAAESGAQTLLAETNTNAGRKLLLTGGGRCNLTHVGSAEDIAGVYGAATRFLRYCLHEFSPDDVRRFLAAAGLKTKQDGAGCVFPVSERASDVRDVLVDQARKMGTQFLFGKRVRSIEKDKNCFAVGIGRDVINAHKVIITTGGLSWPRTGSTGDGYGFARRLGHTIKELKPALVPLITKEKWCGKLAGTAIDKVRITGGIDRAKICVTGAMVFTQDGIGGPAVLNLSRELVDHLPSGEQAVQIAVDLACEIGVAELERELVILFAAHPRKLASNIVAEFVPRRLAAVLCERLGIADDLWACNVTRKQRKQLACLLKALPLSVVDTGPIEEATVTHGGISLDELDPKTMQSKIRPGLFFAGEVIDADGPCGGYNLQIAFSTGAVAGRSAASR